MHGLDRWTAAGAGLLFGFSLIVAIGPQNTFVLVQGARRRHVALVVATCAVCDVVMITAGVVGSAAAFTGRPWLIHTTTAAGVAFLVGYGGLALRRAVRPGGVVVDPDLHRPGQTWRVALLACLAFTWLNPGVYLDTVFLVGPVSQAHGGQRWWFAGGAMLASVVWFVLLGYGARVLTGVLARPGAWRVLDGAVAAVMGLTAVRLLA